MEFHNTAPAWPPPGENPLETFLSLISSRILFVLSGTIHPNGKAGLPVTSLVERLKFVWMFEVRSTSS